MTAHFVCADCGQPVDYRRPGVGERVTGIRQNRAAGGANQIIAPKGLGEWLCAGCVEAAKLRAIHPDQRRLFD